VYEIEKKFLIDKSKMPIPKSGTEIRQGYLAIEPDGNEIRVREKGEKFFLTVKSCGDMQRCEGEIEISEEQFEMLWGLTEGRRIEKMRYEFPLEGGLVCELDVFSGLLRGFVMAEVEFNDIKSAESFIPPDWFKEEVTNDSRYKNKNLAVKGI